MGYYVYKLVATLIPKGLGRDTVNHDLGAFTTIEKAERVLQEYVKNGRFPCSVYCYSIEFLPLDDEMEFSSGRRLNIYSSNGELQISEMNCMSCSVNWQGKFHIRIVVDIGPQQKAYFLLYNHWNRKFATKCARISFLEPKYILQQFGLVPDESRKRIAHGVLENADCCWTIRGKESLAIRHLDIQQ